MSDKPKLLIIDDDKVNTEIITGKLKSLDILVMHALRGEDGVQMAQQEKPDIILLDVVMPGMDGFEVIRQLKKYQDTSIIPIVMITALDDVKSRVKALELGADDFLNKDVDWASLTARIKSLLKIKQYNDSMREYQINLQREVEKKTEALQHALAESKKSAMEIIMRLTRASEYRDEDTGSHIQRISRYSACIAKAAGCSSEMVENISYAAAMHDIGKIGTPDIILLKTGRLTPEEFNIMKSHSVIGQDILKKSDIPFVNLGGEIARNHHEKWNGEGYPDGLKGNEIPLAARIVSIVDVFDALLSKRPYKEPLSIEKSLAILQEGRGTHFDPELIDIFFKVLPEINEIRSRFADEKASLFYQTRGIGS